MNFQINAWMAVLLLGSAVYVGGISLDRILSVAGDVTVEAGTSGLEAIRENKAPTSNPLPSINEAQ